MYHVSYWPDQDGLSPQDALLDVGTKIVRLASLSGSWPEKEVIHSAIYRLKHFLILDRIFFDILDAALVSDSLSLSQSRYGSSAIGAKLTDDLIHTMAKFKCDHCDLFKNWVFLAVNLCPNLKRLIVCHFWVESFHARKAPIQRIQPCLCDGVETQGFARCLSGDFTLWCATPRASSNLTRLKVAFLLLPFLTEKNGGFPHHKFLIRPSSRVEQAHCGG